MSSIQQMKGTKLGWRRWVPDSVALAMLLFMLAVLHVPSHTLLVLGVFLWLCIWMCGGTIVLALCWVIRDLIVDWWEQHSE